VTYAMLRHRMFDVGFVISRALVFTILSVIVVLAFSALEWLVGKSLLALGHVQSVALEAGLALGLGLSMDRLRGRVDHAVDNIFFRERHRAERALQRLADECVYITSEDALVDRTLDALLRYAKADGAALYFHDADGGYRVRGATMPVATDVDENDPAVVSLRARRAPVDVNDDESAPSRLPGIIAFPMLVRGELSGMICCASRNGEAYDPDDRRLLAALATALASAFATIESVELREGIDRALTAQQPLEALRELRLRFG